MPLVLLTQTLLNGLRAALSLRNVYRSKDPNMPDFWDKLFKVNLGPNDPSFAIHAVISVLTLYAQSVITKSQIVSILVDSDGNALTPAEQAQATILTDAIDAQTGTPAKVNHALRIGSAALLAELGQVNKNTAKSIAGV